MSGTVPRLRPFYIVLVNYDVMVRERCRVNIKSFLLFREV